MSHNKNVIGFLGAGGIARSHAFSLSSMKFYYNDAPAVDLAAVCSSTEKSRNAFAAKYGFNTAVGYDDFINDQHIDTVFILGPNNIHFAHFRDALQMKSVKRIYLEKPVCSNDAEAVEMLRLLKAHPGVKVQVGFQFLMAPAIRQMIKLWKSGFIGDPIHFDLKYYHGDYLRKEYRDKRQTRLTPAPDGGAMADLGSHSISLLIALFGDKLEVASGIQGGSFIDVIPQSDLFSLISLYDKSSGAVGTVAASRVSSGTGDYFSAEVYAKKGALKFSTLQPDEFHYFTEESGNWTKVYAGSSYGQITGYPSAHVPSGWLRSMIHAHYVFLSGNDQHDIVPDLMHGLAVQKIVNATAINITNFRNSRH